MLILYYKWSWFVEQGYHMICNTIVIMYTFTGKIGYEVPRITIISCVHKNNFKIECIQCIHWLDSTIFYCNTVKWDWAQDSPSPYIFILIQHILRSLYIYWPRLYLCIRSRLSMYAGKLLVKLHMTWQFQKFSFTVNYRYFLPIQSFLRS